MTVKEVLRDAPAGQLARKFLGWTIALYEDEKEGYTVPRPSAQGAVPQAAPRDETVPTEEVEEPSEQESDDGLKDKENNIEGNTDTNGQNATTGDPELRDIERAATEKESAPSNPAQPDFNEVAFSPDDRDNPQNWSSPRKAFAFVQICLLTFSSKSCLAPMKLSAS